MVTGVRCAALLGFLVLSIACDGRRGPTAPIPPSPPPPPVTGPPPPPPLSGEATTFRFRAVLVDAGSGRVSRFTEHSSFVIYESGDFDLRYEHIAHPYRGRYERSEEKIAFYFSERSHLPDAIGTLKGDVLEVRYSEPMQHSDFENAAYQRVD
jgi:hypothetical protein